ncbi:hypothetical protein [Leptospira sp. 'Mane']|uniref:hypothetical protein n=1 Tax=Leptospira sp. 'Mane' TaxID=3387407 RepID=UPI00398BA8FA
MFQLYCGLVRNGIWYNYAEVQPISGGVLSIMDGLDKSGAGYMLKVVEGSVKALYTKDGQSYQLEPEDYKDIKGKDGWKICEEASKLFTGEKHHLFEEHFFCPVCSTTNNEKYTHVKESWSELAEKGLIDEHYLNDPSEFRWTTELPVPIEIKPLQNHISGGTYTKLVREVLSIGQMVRLSKDSWAAQTEANMLCATWDAEIVEITGLSERELNILKRNNQENFSKKYIKDQTNIEEMLNSERKLGYEGEFRKVSCKHCGSEVGGHLDFTNFFSFLSPKKSNPSAKTGDRTTRSTTRR